MHNARCLVITEIFDTIRARVATGRTAEVAAAAGALTLRGAGGSVLAGGRGFRRPAIGWRQGGQSHPDDRFRDPLRHVGAAAHGPGDRFTPGLLRAR